MSNKEEESGPAPPEIMRGDEISVEGYRTIIYSIVYDGDRDPEEVQVGVVYLEDNRGMANFAKWSAVDRGWKFLKGEIARDARPALDDLVNKLRFRVVK